MSQVQHRSSCLTHRELEVFDTKFRRPSRLGVHLHGFATRYQGSSNNLQLRHEIRCNGVQVFDTALRTVFVDLYRDFEGIQLAMDRQAIKIGEIKHDIREVMPARHADRVNGFQASIIDAEIKLNLSDSVLSVGGCSHQID
jgi:hypothetical protein